MQRTLVSVVLSMGLVASAMTSAFAQVGETAHDPPGPVVAQAQGQQGGQIAQTPLPIPNCSVNPANTADPAAVAAAQRALADFFAMTNRQWSEQGFSSAEGMRTTLGNAQSDWYDQTVPLACGRLSGGYKGMNWVPGEGWAHKAGGRPPTTGATAAAPVAPASAPAPAAPAAAPAAPSPTELPSMALRCTGTGPVDCLATLTVTEGRIPVTGVRFMIDTTRGTAERTCSFSGTTTCTFTLEGPVVQGGKIVRVFMLAAGGTQQTESTVNCNRPAGSPC